MNSFSKIQQKNSQDYKREKGYHTKNNQIKQSNINKDKNEINYPKNFNSSRVPCVIIKKEKVEEEKKQEKNFNKIKEEKDKINYGDNNSNEQLKIKEEKQQFELNIPSDNQLLSFTFGDLQALIDDKRDSFKENTDDKEEVTKTGDLNYYDNILQTNSEFDVFNLLNERQESTENKNEQDTNSIKYSEEKEKNKFKEEEKNNIENNQFEKNKENIFDKCRNAFKNNNDISKVLNNNNSFLDNRGVDENFKKERNEDPFNDGLFSGVLFRNQEKNYISKKRKNSNFMNEYYQNRDKINKFQNEEEKEINSNKFNDFENVKNHDEEQEESEKEDYNSEEEEDEKEELKFKKENDIEDKNENYRYNHCKYCLCYQNIIIDKYFLGFTLIMNKEHIPKKFFITCDEKNTYAFIQFNHRISYFQNPEKISLFQFEDKIPIVKGGISWRYIYRKILKNKILNNYFTNIDIKNAVRGRLMRHGMLFKKDSEDQDEFCFNNINQVPQEIKFACELVNNNIEQKYCDFNKKCFWVTCDKSVDLHPLLSLDKKNYYLKNLNDNSWENYSSQKTVIIALEDKYSKKIGDFLKIWTKNGRIVLSNINNYDKVAVYNTVIIFSFCPFNNYIMEDVFKEVTLNIRFEKLQLKSGADIIKFIQEVIEI